MRKILNRVGFHWWKFHHDTGFNKYYICTISGKRKVVCPCSVFQPIDYKWLGNNYVIEDWNKFVY